jgi:two-component system NtrC family sensor kinase
MRAARTLRALVVAALLVPLLILAGGALQAWRESWRQANLELSRSADALAEYALRVLDGQRLLLDRTAELVQGLSDRDLRLLEHELRSEFHQVIAGLPQVQTVAAFDSRGHLLVSGHGGRVPRDATVADRDFFREIFTGGAAEPYLGAVQPGPLGGGLAFTLSRRRSRPGELAPAGFDGVLVVALDPQQVAEGFGRLSMGSADAMALLRADGNVLARRPGFTAATLPAPLPAGSLLMRAATEGQERITFETHDLVEGTRMLAVARKVEGWPVHAIAARPRSTVVEAWRKAVLAQLLIVMPGALALVALALAALRGGTREREALAALQAEAARRETAEAALQRSRRLEALGQLTGGVAHDFNNLLQVVTSGLALLDRSPEGARRQAVLAAMRQAAERGGRLTQQLLAFARRQPLAPQPLDLAERLGQVRELLERSLRGDIRLDLDLPPGLWPAQADPTQLEVALLNLAVNARDAMPRGGVLSISASNVTLPMGADPDGLVGSFLRISVRDTGEGMPPEVLARAFEPFFTTKERGRGTGLGLAQVYGFARQSGGATRLESVAGCGTVVQLLLPRAAEIQPRADAPKAAPAPSPASSLSVLVVEDDAEVGALTEELLRQLGHRTTRVATAEAALGALADGRHIDLLLTDVVIPGGRDGLDLALEARRRRPGLPVLLASGFAGAPNRVAASGLPLLRKPYAQEELQAAIEAVVRPPVVAETVA